MRSTTRGCLRPSGRPRPGSDPRGDAAAMVAAVAAICSSSLALGVGLRQEGRLSGSSYGGGTEVLVEQPRLATRLPRAQCAPPHAEVTLDRPGDRGARHHLAGEPSVLGVELHHGVHVGGGTADVDHHDPAHGRPVDGSRPIAAASTSTPVSTRSGVAPRTIDVKSARVLRCLPPITWARNISRIARRAGSGWSTPIRGTTLSVTTTGRSPSASRDLGLRGRVAGDDDRAVPATRGDPARARQDAVLVATVGATRQQHDVRPRRRCQLEVGRVVGGPAEHRDHLAAAGERHPAAGLRGDQLLVADDRDPQATSGRGAREHLGVGRDRMRSSELGAAGVEAVEHVALPSGSGIVVRWLAVPSSAPVAPSTSAALVKVEPKSTQITAADRHESGDLRDDVEAGEEQTQQHGQADQVGRGTARDRTPPRSAASTWR